MVPIPETLELRIFLAFLDFFCGLSKAFGISFTHRGPLRANCYPEQTPTLQTSPYYVETGFCQ